MNENGTKMTVGADALAIIQETAVKASRAEFITDNNFPDHVAYIATPDGKVEERELPPVPRGHTFDTLKSLINFAQNIAAGDHGKGTKPVAFQSGSLIQVLVDDNTRRDKGVLELGNTPQWKALMECGGRAMLQQDMVRFLRINLRDTLPAGANLLSLMRSIKFTAGSSGDGNIQHGKESMGKSISAEVLGTEALPETVTLNVRIFDVPDLTAKFSITCALDILTHEQQFRLVPLPMQMQDALAVAGDQIFDRLTRDLDCPVYRGSAFGE